MANGLEDLAEKRRSDDGSADGQPTLRAHQFAAWTNFQGREDAEMLHEKQRAATRFRSQKDYERATDDAD